MTQNLDLHCKNMFFPFLSQPGCHLPNSPWLGIVKLFPAMESLVSDITAYLFFTVTALGRGLALLERMLQTFSG
jgi:hypothetical protein